VIDKLVERLRRQVVLQSDDEVVMVCGEAADRIEELERVLREAAEIIESAGWRDDEIARVFAISNCIDALLTPSAAPEPQ
jgi:hypothetical protein